LIILVDNAPIIRPDDRQGKGRTATLLKRTEACGKRYNIWERRKRDARRSRWPCEAASGTGTGL